jgi:hypothetical protein
MMTLISILTQTTLLILTKGEEVSSKTLLILKLFFKKSKIISKGILINLLYPKTLLMSKCLGECQDLDEALKTPKGIN